MLHAYRLLLLLAIVQQRAAAASPDPQSTPPPLDHRQQRIAVVGAGIGGAATAYYIQQLLKNASLPAASITVYERSDYIGGRLKHISFGPSGTHVELGGAAWVDSNRYMMDLTRELGINHSTTTIAAADPAAVAALPNISGELGVWTGSRFAGLEGVLLRSALSELRLALAEGGFLAAIQRNYAEQAAQPPFNSIEQFVGWGGLTQYTNKSIEAFFAARGVKEEVIKYGMVPLTRAIYNRNGGANAFALLASLTAELSHHQV